MDSILFPVLLTLKISFLSTFFVFFIGIFISYILAKVEFRGRNILEIIVTLPMVLPPTVLGYLLALQLGKNGIIGSLFYKLTGSGILFTWEAGVIASFIVSLPLMVKTTTAAISAVDKELEHVSYTLGNTKLGTALLITLPLSKKGIIAGMVLSFARSVGEFGATLMVAGNMPGKTNTMSLSIYQAFQTGQYDLANVLVITLILMSFLSIYVTGKMADKLNS
ncbi:molybdate transport system permease protein [Methanococcus maripaludis]|uniref:Molybdate transport system permease protein n=1 Tax=Methanococcus maripaludis TaxID=39152 RepID=A0A7J9NPV8_METMI|nr:molybdate ABC transporter permease subunit [Methanococcus maripaludis]MBA2841032.1 molybdate transport system permease protein [Methanococcus maripaludis]MBA2853586.1 molybdate transport system permease protein [Methanococcus maripaludis]MBA2860772.1 molybdate transport system permease protein [Methanococcus maripaludis]MBA2869699.1 molybdate transport system permease protein [Methanococcus maripaludis]MBB6402344.1 molybdate transport system permease protein [Methanococcus maripaludis]